MPASAARLLLVLVVAVAVVPGWSDQRYLLRLASRPAPGYHELDSIRDAPRSVLIESPEADVVMLVLQRPAITTPRPQIPVTDRPNPCFRRDLDENAALLRYYGGYAYFPAGEFQLTDATTAAELERLVHLVPLSTTPTGTVYQVARVRGTPRPRALPC